MLWAMRVVRVALGERSYVIQIGSQMLAELGEECQKLGLGERCAVITDGNVAPLYGEAVVGALRGAG